MRASPALTAPETWTVKELTTYHRVCTKEFRRAARLELPLDWWSGRITSIDTEIERRKSTA